MTVILALREKNDGPVYIAYDSRVVSRYFNIPAIINKVKPLFQNEFNKQNNFFIGFSGRVRLPQLIHNIKIQKPNGIIGYDEKEKFILNEFILKIRDYIINNSDGLIEDGTIDGEGIIVWGSDIFYIVSDLTVMSIKGNCWGIGQSDIGMGVLKALEQYDMKPEEKLTKAMKITSELYNSCSEPFFIVKSDFSWGIKGHISM